MRPNNLVNSDERHTGGGNPFRKQKSPARNGRAFLVF